jgi:hypothetical protein
MLVTFTEAYLQDGFALIIAGAFSSSNLPDPIIEEVTGKWIRQYYAARKSSPDSELLDTLMI